MIDQALEVSTPLALAGLSIAILFYSFKLCIKNRIFGRISNRGTERILEKIFNRMFILALLCSTFGFSGYAFQTWDKNNLNYEEYVNNFFNDTTYLQSKYEVSDDELERAKQYLLNNEVPRKEVKNAIDVILRGLKQRERSELNTETQTKNHLYPSNHNESTEENFKGANISKTFTGRVHSKINFQYIGVEPLNFKIEQAHQSDENQQIVNCVLSILNYYKVEIQNTLLHDIVEASTKGDLTQLRELIKSQIFKNTDDKKIQLFEVFHIGNPPPELVTSLIIGETPIIFSFAGNSHFGQTLVNIGSQGFNTNRLIFADSVSGNVGIQNKLPSAQVRWIWALSPDDIEYQLRYIHASGDLIPCSHIIQTKTGPRPLHPNGDIIPCQHPVDITKVAPNKSIDTTSTSAPY